MTFNLHTINPHITSKTLITNYHTVERTSCFGGRDKCHGKSRHLLPDYSRGLILNGLASTKIAALEGGKETIPKRLDMS